MTQVAALKNLKNYHRDKHMTMENCFGQEFNTSTQTSIATLKFTKSKKTWSSTDNSRLSVKKQAIIRVLLYLVPSNSMIRTSILV